MPVSSPGRAIGSGLSSIALTRLKIRAVGADTKRQHQDRNGAEPGVLRQHADAVTEIREHGYSLAFRLRAGAPRSASYGRIRRGLAKQTGLVCALAPLDLSPLLT